MKNRHSQPVVTSSCLSRAGRRVVLAAGVVLSMWFQPVVWSQEAIAEKLDAVLAAEVSAIGTYFPCSAELELSDGTVLLYPWHGPPAVGYPIMVTDFSSFRTYLNLSDRQLEAALVVLRGSSDRYWSGLDKVRKQARKKGSHREADYRFVHAEKTRAERELRSILRPMQFKKAQGAVFRMMVYWDGLVGMLVEADREVGLQSTPIGKALGIRPKQADRLRKIRREFQDRWKEMMTKGYTFKEDQLAFEREFTDHVLSALDADQRFVLAYWLDLSSGFTKPSQDRVLFLLNLKDPSDVDARPPRAQRGWSPVRISSAREGFQILYHNLPHRFRTSDVLLAARSFVTAAYFATPVAIGADRTPSRLSSSRSRRVAVARAEP